MHIPRRNISIGIPINLSILTKSGKCNEVPTRSGVNSIHITLQTLYKNDLKSCIFMDDIQGMLSDLP